MPSLSVAALLFLSIRRQRRRPVVYYDLLPRYIRGIIRICRISEKNITSVLSILLLVELRGIVHGDRVQGYGDAHLASQENTSDIAEALIGKVQRDPWTGRMAKLYGEKPSLSYLLKCISNEYIFPHLLSTNVYYCAAAGNESLLVWNPHWPEEWISTVEKYFKGRPVVFYRWPSWYRFLLSLIQRVYLLLKFITLATLAFFRRSVAFGKIEKKHYKVIAEFIDPVRMNHGPHDADFIVDGNRINTGDILFFLASDQRKRLKEMGYDVQKLLMDLSENKGYEVRNTDDYPYTGETLELFLKVFLFGFAGIWRSGNIVLCRFFFDAWREYMELSSMFKHCSAEAFFYPAFPNGRTSIRHNSAIATSLCRDQGVVSVNYQTRATHSKNYEYCFDCYDLHFAWGDRWHKMLGQGTMFLDEIRTVGCIYLAGLLQAKALNACNTNEEKASKKITVCIFPSDINLDGRHHYTLDYAVRFMKHCAKLAILYPDIQFIVKSKEPLYTEIITSNLEFAYLYKSAGKNLTFFDKPRHDYADLMASADIIIAVGFTTPGAEALLLGKRVIFYNELKHGGQAFDGIPDLTATNYESLERLFNISTGDYSGYAAGIADHLDRLDPFRDMHAVTRIHNGLFARHS